VAAVYPYSFLTPDLSQVLLAREWRTSATSAGNSIDAEYLLGPPGGPYSVVASEPKEEEEHRGRWVAQSRDGSVAVIESPDHKLTPGQTTGTTSGDDLYAYSGGSLHQINVNAKDETIGACGAELVQGREGGGNRGQGQGYEHAGISLETGSVNAISSNGARIFFEAYPTSCPSREEKTLQRLEGGGPPKIDLYMRVDGSKTVEIGNYTFEGANPEGTRALLSKQGPDGLEYFSYDTETESSHFLFALRGNALGNKHALSEDGNVYYFETSGSSLTTEAPPNASDIYRYDIPTESMSFVARSEQNLGNTNGGFYVSPDGSDFYFNVNSVPGVSGGDGTQIYRYDSAEDVVQCVSCASPFAPEPGLPSTFMPVFGPVPANRIAPLASPGSADGDFVFFDTPAALLPQDANGKIAPIGELAGGSDYFSPSSDVYEWRRDGVDGCGRVAGCLALITNGIDGMENVLLGTDPSGRDVFIGTHSQLVPADTDDSGDIYDARIDGGFPPPAPRPTECEGDACSTPASAPVKPPQVLLAPPPVLPSLAGVQLAPAGKAKPAKCTKGRVLGHVVCVKRKGKRKRTRRPARRSGRHGR
jgi:hypothetical protein